MPAPDYRIQRNRIRAFFAVYPFARTKECAECLGLHRVTVSLHITAIRKRDKYPPTVVWPATGLPDEARNLTGVAGLEAP